MSKAKDEAAEPRSKRHIPFWQKGLLAFGILVGIGGLALWAFGGEGTAPEKTAATSGTGASARTPSGGESLLPGESPPYTEPGGTSSATETSSEGGGGGSSEWGPPLARLGFSFVAGFAIAYALRVFMKITLIVLGGILIVLFGLQYLGWISVDWSLFERGYDSLAAWVSANAGTFKDFVTGNLPSAGSAVAGIVVGFKRG